MIEMTIPGRGIIKINSLVLDVNGTIALDGALLPGVLEKLRLLKDRVDIFMVTSNTYSRQNNIDLLLDMRAQIILKGNEISQKKDFINQLNSENVIAIGNGANDVGMLEAAAIGICVLSPEGTNVKTLMTADIVVPDILTALELIENPLRIVATLRQ
ncbi:MAG: ATPase P [Chloroflexi bacterium HGW-Chloroflexi-8]|nr:MAG: ATPase P [Chloroflexi bacterium HGW-Chloroflexi-8]